MKILHLVDRWSQGGVPQVITNICRQLQQHGHSFKVVTYRRDQAGKTIEIGGEEVKLHSLDASLKNIFTSCRKLHEIFRQYQPDVIHDHYGGLWSASYLFRNKWAERAIYHVHNEFRVISDSPDAKRTFRTNLFLNYLIPRYQKIIAISRHVRQTLLEDTPATGRDIEVVYNSINANQFLEEHSEDQNVREDYDLSSYEVVIGTVGRFVYEKGFDTVVDVLYHLRAVGIDAAALLVGSGDVAYESDVKELANELNVSKYCRFTGYQKNTADFMQAMDYFLFCSRQEPFGITLLEAMACHVPVVAARQKYGGGPEEILEDQINATVTDYEDSESLAANIKKLYSNRSLEQSLIAQASESLNSFTHEVMFQQFERVYEMLAGIQE